MLLKQVIEAFSLIDDAGISGEGVAARLWKVDPDAKIDVRTVKGTEGSTDFLKLFVPGSKGQAAGGHSRTLGIIGKLGGVGARPEKIGAVSDADGAIVVIALGLKLLDMQRKGDALQGDIIISTHICPRSPVMPHKPVPFMGSPVGMATMNEIELDERMDGILSIDATKGNEIVNCNGFAISPTVKEGYILRVSKDLLAIMRQVTGRPPVTFPLSMADITPYGNGLDHINSIMQPSTATDSPVVGVATTSEAVIPGIGTGVNDPLALEAAARYCLEVAKEYGNGSCNLYDEEEFRLMLKLYGAMRHLQTLPSTEIRR